MGAGRRPPGAGDRPPRHRAAGRGRTVPPRRADGGGHVVPVAVLVAPPGDVARHGHRGPPLLGPGFAWAAIPPPVCTLRHVDDRFLRACRLEPVDRTPVWFMRQAGRYLPEYRALREGRDILVLCRSPELAVEATLQPLRRMPLDAAILFSDIMVPVAEMGADVRIEPGSGPFRREPVRAP